MTELVRELKRDQSLVSHNLKRLVSSKLIVSRKEGQFRYYALNRDAVDPIIKTIDGLGKFIYSKTDAELRTTRAQFDQVIRISPVAIFIQEDGRITFTNRAGLKLLGARVQAEIVGQDLARFVNPDHLPELKRRSAAMVAGHRLRPCEFRMVRLDGGIIDVVVNEEPLQGSKGWVSILVDITERKASERLMVLNQSLINMALAAAHAVAWHWDVRTDSVEMLGDAVNVLGTKPTTGRAIWSLLHPEDLAVQRADFEDSMRKPRGYYVRRVRIIRPDNREVRWIELRASAYYENGVKTLVVGMATEVRGK